MQPHQTQKRNATRRSFVYSFHSFSRSSSLILNVIHQVVNGLQFELPLFKGFGFLLLRLFSAHLLVELFQQGEQRPQLRLIHRVHVDVFQVRKRQRIVRRLDHLQQPSVFFHTCHLPSFVCCRFISCAFLILSRSALEYAQPQ